MNSIPWQPIRIVPVWRVPGLAVAALVALLLLAFRGTALGMVEIWYRSETFAHAFVVPPIVAWLIWRQRAVLRTIAPRPVPWMVPALALLAAVWWLGNLVSVNAVTQLALTAMLVAAVPTVLGWQVADALLFPLAFLFFAVPIGEFMTPTLMHYTADFTVAALRTTGVPVYREGQQFVIPSGHWSVIDECSGIRYLMATVMVGSLFAYLNYRSARRRLIFVAVSFVVPIVANWLRAYLIVMLAHLSGNKLATGVDHIIYGWVFFGIVVMSLFFIGARWAEDDAPPPSAPDASPADHGNQGLARRVVLVAGAALLATQLPLLLPRQSALPGSVPRLALPDAWTGDWRADAQALTSWRPIYVGASIEAQRSYRSADGRVALYLAYYRDQSDSRKLVSSVNVLLPMRDNEWNQLATGRQVLARPGGSVDWQTAKLLSSEAQGAATRQHLTVWRAHWVGGRLTGSDIEAKLWQAWLLLKGEPDDAADILLVVDNPDDTAAQRLLGHFADANLDAVQQFLQGVRAVR